MDLGLRGKVALVTASSRGLGRAVAEELAAEGARLIICARDQSAVTAAGNSLAKQGGTEVLALSGDVSNRADIERIVNDGVDRFGRIDILVANSGGPPPGSFAAVSPGDWDTAVAELLTSAVELTRLVLPGMKERGWGRVLFITSIAAKQPVPDLILSNSIRAAVTGFAKTLSTEVATFGVTVNTILPGFTATERVQDLARRMAEGEGVGIPDVLRRWETEIPIGRLGRPEEFAALAAFLVSERASYITGSSVAVDGGWIRSLF